MDFITTGVIASAVYDMLKQGIQLTAGALKERFGKWIKEDVLSETLASELEQLNINEDLSELAINRKLESSLLLPSLLQRINATAESITTSTITSVTQTHSGSGDNVAGNKITH